MPAYPGYVCVPAKNWRFWIVRSTGPDQPPQTDKERKTRVSP